jgi:hypothetical protein
MLVNEVDREATKSRRYTAKSIIKGKSESSPKFDIQIFVTAANAYCLVGHRG